jgi:hypothetical protein
MLHPLAAGREGMQHWSSWPVNYHEIRERALTIDARANSPGIDQPSIGPSLGTKR